MEVFFSKFATSRIYIEKISNIVGIDFEIVHLSYDIFLNYTRPEWTRMYDWMRDVKGVLCIQWLLVILRNKKIHYINIDINCDYIHSSYINIISLLVSFM